MDLVVRPFEAADAAACADVHVAAWRVAYRGMVADAYLESAQFEAGRREIWQRIASSPPAVPGEGPVSLVAVSDDVVLGFATWGPARGDDVVTRSGRDGTGEADPSAGEVWAIYVDPRHWGAGVGAALMAACLDGLSASGRGDVRVWVLADNARARAFYAGWGFVDSGRGQDIDLGPGGTPHEVEMRRDGPTG